MGMDSVVGMSDGRKGKQKGPGTTKSVCFARIDDKNNYDLDLEVSK
jgi:hypothetical protein